MPQCSKKLEAYKRDELHKMVVDLRAQAELKRVMAKREYKTPRKVDLCEALRRRSRKLTAKTVAGAVGGTAAAAILVAVPFALTKKPKKKSKTDTLKNELQQIQDAWSYIKRSKQPKNFDREKYNDTLEWLKNAERRYIGPNSELTNIEQEIRLTRNLLQTGLGPAAMRDSKQKQLERAEKRLRELKQIEDALLKPYREEYEQVLDNLHLAEIGVEIIEKRLKEAKERSSRKTQIQAMEKDLRVAKANVVKLEQRGEKLMRKLGRL